MTNRSSKGPNREYGRFATSDFILKEEIKHNIKKDLKPRFKIDYICGKVRPKLARRER
jgi:hypothetical protein